MYNAPKTLRRVSSRPELGSAVELKGIRKLYDDHDTSMLAFDFHCLPFRPPPRVHNGKTPQYPMMEDHELCPVKNGSTNHSFIVVGWFPGKLMEPMEVCMWYDNPEKFLSELHHHINVLRGWKRYLSLNTVQASISIR